MRKPNPYPPPRLGLMLSEETVESLIEYSFKIPTEYEGGKVEHLTRLGVYSQLRDKFSSHHRKSDKTLAISLSSKLAEVLGLGDTQVCVTEYPEHDLLNLHQIEDSSFDFVVSDMVLEHVNGSPFRAFDETYRVLKPGGRFCHTSVFMTEIHEPIDMWRFTPKALELMSQDKFTDVETGGAGSREWVGLMLTGFRKQPIPDDPNHPIYKLAQKTEADFLVSVWVCGTKPLN